MGIRVRPIVLTVLIEGAIAGATAMADPEWLRANAVLVFVVALGGLIAVGFYDSFFGTKKRNPPASPVVRQEHHGSGHNINADDVYL